MNTQPELILLALLARFQTDVTLCDGNVFRSRPQELGAEMDKGLVIKPATVSEADRVCIGQYRWVLNVPLEFYCRGDIPDSLADPEIAKAYALLCQDKTLGGVCDNIEPGSREWEFDARDTDLVVTIFEINIEFTTSENSL